MALCELVFGGFCGWILKEDGKRDLGSSEGFEGNSVTGCFKEENAGFCKSKTDFSPSGFELSKKDFGCAELSNKDFGCSELGFNCPKNDNPPFGGSGLGNSEGFCT